ncbi:hypothetical protein ACFL3C_01955 [Patescibacteria group bacterium]
MNGLGENPQIGRPSAVPREHGDVKARLRGMREASLEEADAVIADLENGNYEDEDALLGMEEAA